MVYGVLNSKILLSTTVADQVPEHAKKCVSTLVLVWCLHDSVKTQEQQSTKDIHDPPLACCLLASRPIGWPSRPCTPHQPSLLPLVDFLVNVFGWRLPQETCVSCDKKVLPDDPRGPSLKDPAHKDRPTRQALNMYCRTSYYCSLDSEWSRISFN